MHIESVEFLNYGPFAIPETLVLEPMVTVLTGPNDVGKSSVLRLLSRFCYIDGKAYAEESEFNHDNLFSSQTEWQKRDDFGAIVKINLAEPRLPGFQKKYQGVSWLEVKLSVAPENPQRVIRQGFHGLNNPANVQGPLPNSFQAVVLPPTDQIRDVINPQKANGLEERLLRQAFGREFQFGALTKLSTIGVLREFERAEQRLNVLVERVIPKALGLTWTIRAQPDMSGLGFLLRDHHGGVTALGSRGSGIRKVMSVLAHLMDHNFDQSHTLVLFDEPENSLHADSQHLVRQLLENLAEKPNIQVVYATHSPAMINTMRPQSIRLLRRETRDGKATTIIDNQPFGDNYLPVRTSLGITPADSLLYAPLTVVVEGDTEVVGLQLLLLKLGDAGVTGFEEARQLLEQSHFLDGMGDRYPFVCKMAKSQGAKAVIFLDGDKVRHLAQHKLQEHHPDVPVVTLPNEQEFEQLVPRAVYFQAIAEVLGIEPEEITEERYSEWEHTANLPRQLMFSKRVDRWLSSKQINQWSKPRVMRRAIELVDVEQVNPTPLLELVQKLKMLLDKSCFMPGSS